MESQPCRWDGDWYEVKEEESYGDGRHTHDGSCVVQSCRIVCRFGVPDEQTKFNS